MNIQIVYRMGLQTFSKPSISDPYIRQWKIIVNGLKICVGKRLYGLKNDSNDSKDSPCLTIGWNGHTWKADSKGVLPFDNNKYIYRYYIVPWLWLLDFTLRNNVPTHFFFYVSHFCYALFEPLKSNRIKTTVFFNFQSPK